MVAVGVEKVDRNVGAGNFRNTSGQVAIGDNINQYKIQTPTPKTKKLYYIFLSCKHDETCKFCTSTSETPQNISQGCKEKKGTNCELKFICINKSRIRHNFPDTEIKFINRHESIRDAYQDMKRLFGHSVFVINHHRNANNITYFQLGYAKGKGVEVLGLCDEANKEVILPPDMTKFIYNDSRNNITEFIRLLKICLITKVNPYLIDDDPKSWDDMLEVHKTSGGIIEDDN